MKTYTLAVFDKIPANFGGFLTCNSINIVVLNERSVLFLKNFSREDFFEKDYNCKYLYSRLNNLIENKKIKNIYNISTRDCKFYVDEEKWKEKFYVVFDETSKLDIASSVSLCVFETNLKPEFLLSDNDITYYCEDFLVNIELSD